MKIVTVCGLGMGSSLILKMTVESAMKELGRDCDVEHWDMGTIKGKEYDLLVTTEGFKDSFNETENAIFVKNIVDVKEVKEKLEGYFNN